MRFNLPLVLFFLSFSGTVALGKVKFVNFSDEEVDLIVSKLGSQGYTPTELRKIFTDKSVKKIPDMVSMNVTKQKKLTTKQYARYAEEPALSRTRKFKERWKVDLEVASKTYGVDEEVILAIMLVETNLGTYTGKYPVIGVFASVFVDSSQLLSSGDVKRGAKIYPKVKRKRTWALNQLKALLKMKKTHGVNIFPLKGSFSGAMGICQFLPTSFLAYAVSASKGVPNLFHGPDALRSVANYLKGHGYRPGLHRKKNRKAVYAYNHSDVYVNIVLKIAKNLRKTKTAAK